MFDSEINTPPHQKSRTTTARVINCRLNLIMTCFTQLVMIFRCAVLFTFIVNDKSTPFPYLRLGDQAPSYIDSIRIRKKGKCNSISENDNKSSFAF